MHKRFRAISCLVACAVVLAGSSVAVNAAPVTDGLTIENEAVSNDIVANMIEKKVTTSKLITDEIADQLKETLAIKDIVGADIAQIAVAQVEDYVNIRSVADESSEAVGKLFDDAVAVVEAEENGWLKIKSGSVEGYVKADFVVVGDEALIQSVAKTMATVQTEALNVRKEASTDASILTMLAIDTKIEVIDEVNDGWVLVSTEAGEGYVSADYVQVEQTFENALSKAEEKAAQMRTAAGKGQAVVSYASQFLGNPYVYGGTSLTKGADCSGFIMSVYAHFGVSLPHSSSAMRGCGYEVSYAEMQPGDIICYSGHVAIYAGNNTVIHASNEKDGIKYTSPANYRKILSIRRIF